MTHHSSPWRILRTVVAVLVALAPAFALGAPPWDTPGHTFHNNPVGYAQDMHDRYMANKADLDRANADLADVHREMTPYRGTGLFGGAAMGANDPQLPIRREALRRQIEALERIRGDLEREWEEWCHYGLSLGPLSDANETIQDPYLDNTTFPPERKYREMDRIAFRIRYLAGKDDPPKGTLPPDHVGTVHCAGGATIAQANPPVGLKPGQQIMSQGGSFPGKDDDADIVAGVFPIPAACKIRAHVVGTPPVGGVWSLYNANTGMAVSYQRRLGGRLGAAEGVIGLGGQTTDNDLTGEAILPGPGQITVTFGHPRGAGPLFGGNFAQGFQGEITVVETPAGVPATGGARLLHGDRLRTAGQPALIVLPDGTHVNVEPNSEVTLTQVGPGRVRVDLESGRARVLHWGEGGAFGGCEPSVKGRLVRPKGTDFILVDSGDAGSIQVVDGSVSVSGEGPEVTLQAGRQMALPSGEVTDFDATAVRPVLVHGVPLGETIRQSSTPEPFGETVASFAGGLTDGWLLEDPDADAVVETPGGGALQLTVPDGNDFGDTRIGAPRLLHKATGDFDLEAEVAVSSEAADCVVANFTVKSPGCYMGFHEGQFPLDGAGADYWVTSLVRAKGWGNLDKVPLYNAPSPTDFIDSPPGPLRVRYLRRDRAWRAYWSEDGRRWNLCYTSDAVLPDTVWVGWTLKRWAWDGLRDRPGVFTLRNVRLRTAPLGTLDFPEWDTVRRNSEATAEGRSVSLSVRAGAPSDARAYSGGWFAGDFDIAVSFDAGAWTHQPGQMRWWGVWATTDDEKQRYYIGGEGHPQGAAAWIGSDLCIDGTWRGYQRAAVDLRAGKLRLVRQSGRLSTFYWDQGQWTQLGKWDQETAAPLRLALQAHNMGSVQAYQALDVTFRVEDIRAGIPYPHDDGSPGGKPGGPEGQTPPPAEDEPPGEGAKTPPAEAIRLADATASQPLGQDYPTGDFRFVFQVNARQGGTVVDTVGLNAAPVGSFNLRVAGDGVVSFAIYDPQSQSSGRDANGWHTLSVPGALALGAWSRIAVERQGDRLTLAVGPTATRKSASLTLATPLSGEPAFVGDFPGDEHWGAGFNIHQGLTGVVRVVRFAR